MVHEFDNPFANYGRIVSGSRFIGRKEALAEIEKRVLVSNPGNIAIIGGPRIGKSSLVYQSIIEQKQKFLEKKLLPIWINLATYQNSHDFFYALPKECMKELEEWESLLHPNPVILDAADICQQEEKSGKVEFESIKYFFERVRKSDIRVLFVLDEFDASRRIFKDDEAGFQRLRELSYRPACGVTYITTSRRTIYQIEVQAGFSSTLDSIFSNYYVAPFEAEDLQSYYACLNTVGISIAPFIKKEISFYAGGHPYLLDMLSYEIVEIFRNHKKVDVNGAYSKKATSFNNCYKRIQSLFEEDNSLNKLLQILCGPVVDVNHTDVDGFLAYGLIKKGSNNTYCAFAPHFQEYLRLISREIDLWPMLTQTEKALRSTIEKALHSIYGDQWIDELEKKHVSLRTIFQACRKQQQNDVKQFGRAAPNILDNTYIKDLFEIISLEWGNAQFARVFRMSKGDLDIRSQYLRNVRNVLAHHKDEMVIDELQQQKAEIYFREILGAIQYQNV